MSLVPRNSFFDLDNIFEHPWFPATYGKGTTAFSPKVDIREKKNAYEITAELPGVNKDDISITLNNGVLTLTAETVQEDKEEKDGKIIRQERRYGKFMRSFDLGPSVQDSDIKANFKNGVLHLTAPRVEPKVPESRRIAIN